MIDNPLTTFSLFSLSLSSHAITQTTTTTTSTIIININNKKCIEQQNVISMLLRWL
jgi:hypothetical protein